MDPTDLRICQSLFLNSRMPYRELAQKLGISVQAVHRRVQNMVLAGVIQKFTTRISPGQLGGIVVDVFGHSESLSHEHTAAELGKDDRTEAVWFSEDFMLVHGILKELSDLDDFVALAKNRGQMASPTVGIYGGLRVGDATQACARATSCELSPLDYRIVNSIRDDSRKEIAAIAKELRVSTGTVKRHLDKLIQSESLEMSIVFYPGRSPGVTNFMGITVAEGVPRRAFAKELEDAFGSKFIAVIEYLNLHNVMLAFLWTDTVAEMAKVEEFLTTHKSVESMWTYVIRRKFLFDTWRDEILSAKASEFRSEDTH